jgi:hypothetical protein
MHGPAARLTLAVNVPHGMVATLVLPFAESASAMGAAAALTS